MWRKKYIYIKKYKQKLLLFAEQEGVIPATAGGVSPHPGETAAPEGDPARAEEGVWDVCQAGEGEVGTAELVPPKKILQNNTLENLTKCGCKIMLYVNLSDVLEGLFNTHMF